MLIFRFTDVDGYKWIVPEHALLSLTSCANPAMTRVNITGHTFMVNEPVDQLAKRIF